MVGWCVKYNNIKITGYLYKTIRIPITLPETYKNGFGSIKQLYKKITQQICKSIQWYNQADF